MDRHKKFRKGQKNKVFRGRRNSTISGSADYGALVNQANITTAPIVMPLEVSSTIRGRMVQSSLLFKDLTKCNEERTVIKYLNLFASENL